MTTPGYICCVLEGSKFRVWDLGARISESRCRVQGAGCRVWDWVSFFLSLTLFHHPSTVSQNVFLKGLAIGVLRSYICWNLWIRNDSGV